MKIKYLFINLIHKTGVIKEIASTSPLDGAPKKRALSFMLAFTILLTSFSFFSQSLKTTAVSPYWDNTTSPITFGQLPNTFPTSIQNVITLKNFTTENGTGTGFALLSKYKTGNNFNPSSCRILLEDAQDLLAWSQKSYFKNVGAVDPTLERSVYLSANYVLGNNIDYGQTLGMIPIGFLGGNDASLRFVGNFDGQGFEIANLQLTLNNTYFFDELGNPSYYYAMFSNIGIGGVVKNLGLRSPKYEEPFGVNLSLRFGSVAGYNRGTIQYCFDVSGSNRYLSRNAGEIAGIVHTNSGTLDNVYYAGGIYNSSSHASTIYNPVAFLNDTGGIITNAYYDSTLYDTSINSSISGVVSKVTNQLQNRTGILAADQWYTDNYSFNVTSYTLGYPRLQGFKYNNGATNSTANPFYIARPADLIFFSNALNSHPLFGSNTARFFRLRNCIDMSTVSSSAYTTPTNDFYGNFEGTIDDVNQPCVTNHVGTGEQRNCHCIINLQLTKPTYKIISTTQHIFMGLIYNGTSTASFKNINIVGGQVVLPVLSETEAYNTYCSMGTLVSFAQYVKLDNVHNSANVYASGDGDYISKLRLGGIVGCTSITVSASKCSNSGTIDGGSHKYSSTVNNTSMIGGLIGSQDTNGNGVTKQILECINYGTVTGMSVTSNVNTGIAGICYVGGICGFVVSNAYSIDRVINYGAINSLKHLPNGSSVFPINSYYVGGLYGSGPYGPSSGAPTDTRMCNKGTITANRTDVAATGTTLIGGIAGTTGTSLNAYKQAANMGTIMISNDIKSIYAAGITNGAISLYGCYNDGIFSVEDNLALAPIYETRFYGISGGNGTGYNLTNCYNNKDITLKIQNSISNINFRVAGIAYNLTLNNCENYGKLNVTTDTFKGTLYVSGVSDSTSIANSCNNSATINISALEHDGSLYVGGVTQNGNATTCKNNSNIYVERINRTAPTVNKNTYIGGVKIGNQNADVINDCENYGEIGFDYYFTNDATVAAKNAASNVYIGGVAVYGMSLNRCVNNGNIILAKNYDFTGTNAYLSGIVYTAFYSSNSNILQNCRNFGTISNTYNVGSSTITTGRNIYYNGIAYYGSPNMIRCLNSGNITLSSSNTSASTNLYVNGVVHYTGNIDANRVDFGVKGLSNVGELKIDHSQTVLPATSRVFISGIVSQPGTGHISFAGSLPFENLVNGGKITALVKTDNATNYTAPGSNNFISSSSNVAVAGISCMAGYNSNTTNTTSIPIKACANANDIYVDLKCGSVSPSDKIIYNVGGIVANSASNATGFANQKLDIYDCVNQGNITVDTVNNIANSSKQSGVGGILGFGYQYTNGVTTATENNVHSSINNCLNFGNIKGGFSTGGIVGCDGAVVKNVINFGTISGTALSDTGGIIGAFRSANKGNNTRQILALDGAINYGIVQAVPGQSPEYLGSIIGNLAIGQDATYGTRRYEHIINASYIKFVGNVIAQSANTTIGVNTLVDVVSTVSVPPPASPLWETSDNLFKNNILYKNGSSVTDSNSIYFKDTGNDSNSFFWRVGEDLPENNNMFVYIPPEKSNLNTYDSGTGTYSPYSNGIYALSINTGKKSGYYPSSNVILTNCDPILLSGSGYVAWRTDVIGSNTISVNEALRRCRQIKLNIQAEILSLQLTSGGGTPTLLRNGYINQAQSKVIFYVVKDNFTPAVYTPDMYSVNTALSDKASFEGSVSIDLSAGFNFDMPVAQDFGVTVDAEDTTISKNWTIEIQPVLAVPPLVPIQIREGVNIANSSVGYSTHSFSQTDTRTYSLGNVVSTHNDTLILNFNTTGLLPGKNMINDVSLLNNVPSVITPGVSSGGYGTNNTTYYKVVPAGSYGVDSYNYKVISNDYISYTGTLSVNIRLHSNLPSGIYRIAINTVYGMYYFDFTRVPSTEAEVQNVSTALLLSGTVACSINSGTGAVSNSALVYYGNAPDLSKLTQINGNGMFSAKPTVSKNAILGPQRLISVTTNVDGSRVYLFGFNVTSENGTIKNWTLSINTQPFEPAPAAIEVDYNGTTYFGAQVTDPDIMNEIFAMNKTQSGSFLVRYDITKGNTGNKQITNIYNNNNYVYEVYRNSVLIPSSEYATYGISINKQTISNNYLKVSLDANISLPDGAYELRTYYYRPPAPISPSATDDSNNTYTEITWTDKIQYPSFYFFKASGKKLSYATGLTVPYVPDIYTISCGAQSLYWDGTNIDYTALGANITTEENASYRVHRQFNIVFKYKTDAFYYNFKPSFYLPEGAQLYRETVPGEWELVTANNIAADFSGGRIVKYRVYAEDTRFYQDYYIQLLTVLKTKQFNITFQFNNGAPNTLPVTAMLKSIGQDGNNNNIIFGNTTLFSHPSTVFGDDKLPPGAYVFDVDVPYGYQASIEADNSPTANDIYIDGKLVSGNWKMVTAMNDDIQNFSINVKIEPIPGFTTPWGFRRESR